MVETAVLDRPIRRRARQSVRPANFVVSFEASAKLPEAVMDCDALSRIAQRMAPQVLSAFYDMALDPSVPGAVRLGCGEAILNRAYGRPQQQVAVSSVTMDVTQLHLEALRQLNAVDITEAVSAPDALPLTESVRDDLADAVASLAPDAEHKALIPLEDRGEGERPPGGDHLGGALAYATTHTNSPTPTKEIGLNSHEEEAVQTADQGALPQRSVGAD